MDSSSESIDVVAAVIRRGNSYLLCQRPHHKHHGGLWEFPGGKVDEGETHAQAVSRELSEELSLRVASIGRTLYSGQEPGSRFLIHFIEVSVSGEPQTHEHEATDWLTLSQMQVLALAPIDQNFVNYMDIDDEDSLQNRSGV